MKKRVLSLFLAWTMCLSLLPAAWAAEGHKHDLLMAFSNGKLTFGKGFSTGDEFTGVDGLVYPIDRGGNYYLNDDLLLDHPLCIYETTVNICLNGHSIYYNGKTAVPGSYADVVILSEDAIFTLEDCQASAEPAHTHPVCGSICADKIHDSLDWTGVTALTDDMAAGHYYLTDNITLTEPWQPSNDIVLCLNGKTITATNDLDAISISNHTTFTLTDCSPDASGLITHTANQTGIGVHNAGIFHLYGGQITGNAVGIEQYGNMTVSGRIQLFGNVSNVVLADGRCIMVDGVLHDTTTIGVTTENKPNSGNPIAVAEGAANSDHFISDAGYTISYNNGTVYFSCHEHQWDYQRAKNDPCTILETCTDCYAIGGSVTLQVPTNAVYDGQPKTAVANLSDDWSSGAVEITYTKADMTDFSEIPTDTGTYTAYIVCGTAVAEAEFTIAKADLTAADFIFVAPTDLVYDNQIKTASIVANTTDGAVIVQYYRENQAVEPINAGTYTVQLQVEEGTNYHAAVLRSNDWTFTIQRAPQTIHIAAEKSILKNGIPIDIAEWADAPGVLTYELDGNPDGISLNGSLLTVESSATLSDITIIAHAAQTDNYNAASQTFRVMLIDKPRRELDVSMTDWTYGDMPNEPQYAAPGKVLLTYTDADGIPLTGSPVNAGKYIVTVTSETDVEIFTGSAAFTIHPKMLTERMVSEIASYPYSGQSIQPEPEVIDFTTLVPGTDFIYRYGENLNVGSGTVSIIGQENYTGEISRAFAITKAVLTVDGTPIANAVYGMPVKNISITGLRVKLHDTVIPGIWTFSDEAIPNAGNTTAYPAVFTPDTGAENYEPLICSIVPTIAKAPGYGIAPTALSELIYTGSPQTLIAKGTSPTGEMKYRLDNGVYSTALPQAVNAGTYKVWYKSFGDQNHEDTDETFIEVRIAKQPVIIPTADSTIYTYNGKEQRYALTENAAYQIGGAAQTNAGEYEVKVSLLDKNNTCWEGEGENTTDKIFLFRIKPALLTVAAKDRTISVGDELPDWSTPVLDRDYMVFGLFGEDKLGGTPTLHCDPAPDLSSPGQTSILVSGVTAGKNYTIVYQPGKLMIQARQTVSRSGGSSSAPLKHAVSIATNTVGGSIKSSAATASSGSTVIITVTPDTGYQLDKLTVTDAKGTVLSLTDKGNGQYSFMMPPSQITITPVFIKKTVSELMSFRDVSDSDYFYTPIQWAVNNGITDGMSAEWFAPDNACTRAQIITFLWRAAGSPVVNYAMDLQDIPSDSYYTEAIRWALSEGITTGITTNTFCPDGICTRAQAVTFLARAKNAKLNDTATFVDVPIDSWYTGAIAWAASNGITSGISADRFAPDNTCTRAQIVTLLYRSFVNKECVHALAAMKNLRYNTLY